MVRIFHVGLDIAGASYCTTVGLQTNPVLTQVVAVDTRVSHGFVFEVLEVPNVFGDAVGAICFRAYSEESLDFHLAF